MNSSVFLNETKKKENKLNELSAQTDYSLTMTGEYIMKTNGIWQIFYDTLIFNACIFIVTYACLSHLCLYMCFLVAL